MSDGVQVRLEVISKRAEIRESAVEPAAIALFDWHHRTRFPTAWEDVPHHQDWWRERAAAAIDGSGLVERLSTALAYAEHKPDCRAVNAPVRDCTCGLDAFLTGEE